jgi:hypothetical protein
MTCKSKTVAVKGSVNNSLTWNGARDGESAKGMTYRGRDDQALDLARLPPAIAAEMIAAAGGSTRRQGRNKLRAR